MLKICSASSGISGRDRIVVSTSRCGRDNPGSNPGHGMPALLSISRSTIFFFLLLFRPRFDHLIELRSKTHILSADFKTRWPSG